MLPGKQNLLSPIRCRKGDQIADSALLAIPEPDFQWLSIALFEQLHKLLGQSIGNFDLLYLADEGEGLLFPLFQLRRRAGKQPSEMTRGHFFRQRSRLALGLSKSLSLPITLKLDPPIDHHPTPGKAAFLHIVPYLSG